jgi:hypothetical protein
MKKTCNRCYKAYDFPAARGYERTNDGYCSHACAMREPAGEFVPPAYEPPAPYDSSPSIIETAIDIASSFDSTPDTSTPDFGGGGGDFGGGGASSDW